MIIVERFVVVVFEYTLVGEEKKTKKSMKKKCETFCDDRLSQLTIGCNSP